MKKYLSILAVTASVMLTSCSPELAPTTEPITLTHDIKFEWDSNQVDPYVVFTVIPIDPTKPVYVLETREKYFYYHFESGDRFTIDISNNGTAPSPECWLYIANGSGILLDEEFLSNGVFYSSFINGVGGIG